MAGYKVPDFNERSAAARAAKQSALEQLRNKAAPDPAFAAERQAARAARDAAAAERRAARARAAEEAEAARKAAKTPAPVADAAAVADADATADAAAANAPPPAVPERPQPSDAELKAARDARYAARKARKR